MVRHLSLLLFIGLVFWNCGDEHSEIFIYINSIYFGTYLYEDIDCSGSDIQYATIDQNGITLFDYLGDSCDDTVDCYSSNTYGLTELSQDTFLIISEDGSSITNGEIYLHGDSSLTLTYEGNNGPVEYSWD